MDWLDLLAVQGTLKSLLQHHSSKASVLQHSALFTVQQLHPYMTTGKTKALTRWAFVGKVMSLLFNILFGFVIAFLSKSKCLLISCCSHHLQWFGAPKIKSATVSLFPRPFATCKWYQMVFVFLFLNTFVDKSLLHDLRCHFYNI